MAEWFEAKVSFLRQTDNGLIKKVTEQYLVDAMSFTETEARVMQEAGEGMREVIAVAMKRSPIKDVVFYGDTDLWHKVKVTYSLIDEETDKEKKVTTYVLVNSNDVKEAYARTEEHLKEMLVPFQIPKVEQSPICEVFQYEKQAPAGFKKVENSERPIVSALDAAAAGLNPPIVDMGCDMEPDSVESEFYMPDPDKYTVEILNKISEVMQQHDLDIRGTQRIIDQARSCTYDEFVSWMQVAHNATDEEIHACYGNGNLK